MTQNLDFSKRKSELDEQYKQLDVKRQQAIALANQIWEEQTTLRGKYKMLEELEIQSKEAKKEQPVASALGAKKSKK